MLKQSYLAYLNLNPSHDHDCATLVKIIEKDSDFIGEFVDFLADQCGAHIRDERDYSKLWEHHNSQSIIDKIVERILEQEQGQRYIFLSGLRQFFGTRLHNKPTPGVRKSQVEYLERRIQQESKNIALMKLLFEVVSSMESSDASRLTAVYLQQNPDYGDFEQIALEPSLMSWSGSAIPMYQKRIEFLESLLPFVSGVNQLQHRRRIEARIESHQSQIESEKRREFIGSY